ncbi:MAG: anhydro-N-acetylmuramic acid kinase [Ignavibacteriaceae bacterium]|nr:anhydro-N-acetylmuramic acid kinase [Ignavibacteriaceae bacterium]
MLSFINSIISKKRKQVIGLMSGTSLDGIDAVLVEITGCGTNTSVTQKSFITFPFPIGMKEMILRNAETNGGNVTEICKLNFLISLVYVDAIKALCNKAKTKLNQIDFIGSHGQTVHHLPHQDNLFGYQFGSTLQIGDPAVVAKLTGVLTIGDFRTGDVALGGQGAPLVPYFDYLLFSSIEKNRALLNIGGIANITVLNKNGSGKDVFAFDTGPGNMLIDYFTHKLFNKPYDENGAIGFSGKVNEKLLHGFIDLDNYIDKQPPKSTGREYYGAKFISSLRKKHRGITNEDWVATATSFTAYGVYRNYNIFIKNETIIDELFISGGGVYNKFLISELKRYFGKKVKIKNVKSLGISSDAKEAICFAVLANETLNGNASNIPRVTGASRKTILGKICLP